MHRNVAKLLSLFLSTTMLMGSMGLPVLAGDTSTAYEATVENTAEEESAADLEEQTAVDEEAAGGEAAEGTGSAEEAGTVEESGTAGENGTAEEAGAPEEAGAAGENATAEEAGAAEEEDVSYEAEETKDAGEDTAAEDVTEEAAEEVEGSREEGADSAVPEEDAQSEEGTVDATPETAADPAEPAEAITAPPTEEVVTEAVTASEEGVLSGEAYVLMNIPYDEFFAAEGVGGVDAVSTATVKTYNQNMAGGSYHAGYDAAEPISGAQILGVTYPVYVADMSALTGMTAVTDADTAAIAVAAGKSSMTTKEVSGKDLLFASGDYAYYVLSGEPANYKVLSGSNGSYSFSAVHSGAQAAQPGAVKLTYGGHYTDLTLDVEAAEAEEDFVTGVILTADGSDYVLRHVENIWRKTSLGWNWTDLDGAGLSGKTISAVTYYLQDGGVYRYEVDIPVKQQLNGIGASFTGANTITVTGIPEDAQNPKAVVSSVVGRGQTPVVIADGVDVANGTVTTADPAAGGKYNVKVVSDNYADVTVQAGFEELVQISLGGINYYYTDTAGDLENTLYQVTVSSRAGSTVYPFAKADLTGIAGTEYCYTTAPNVTPLSGTLYGFGEGTPTDYKEVYGRLGAATDTDPAYDAVSSATGYTGYHAKDIPSLVSFGTDAGGAKAITGLTLGRSTKTVPAVDYVEAGILQAAGSELTAEQEAALDITLKANPMDAPATSEITVKTGSASFTTSRYGKAEFAIVPDDTVEGYVWSEYWNSVYAATISDGATTVGAVHWIDLYGEAAVSGPHYNKVQIALNNGTSTASNAAEVSRYAAFFDGDYIKAGNYTITVYAEGYSPLTAEVQVGSFLENKTATYNGKEVSVTATVPANVEGDLVCTYYSDAACTKALTAPPKNAGTYYARAVVGDLVASNVAKITIMKAASRVTLKEKTAAYTGKTININKATVSGSSGAVTYAYYTDAKCTKKAASHVNAGTYYVTATVAADANYSAATSAAVKLVIKEEVPQLKKPGNCRFAKWNNAKYNSCSIAWNKVDGADGYQTLLSWTDGSHASATTVKSNVLSRTCQVATNHVSQMKVRAFTKKNGKTYYSPWSNVAFITPSPAKLATKNVSTSKDLKMKISWNIIYGCNGYNVFITTNPNGTWYWNQSTSVEANATSAVITKYRGSKLKKNTKYYVRIVTRRKRNGVFCTVPMPSSNTYVGSFVIK